MPKFILSVIEELNYFLTDFVFGDGALETTEYTKEERPAICFRTTKTRSCFTRFFFEIVPLLMDPFSVEFWREGFELF
jgi:hypothetical protein